MSRSAGRTFALLAVLSPLSATAGAPAAEPAGSGASAAPATRPADGGADVLRVAGGFADGGGYNTQWAGSGCPDEVRHAGERVLARATGGTYCSGFTFAVAMAVAERRGLLAGKDVAQVRAFQKDWYGATPAGRETQCAYAMERLGIGRAVPLTDARPGDFVQLWRVPGPTGKVSGHSVVLVDWVVEGGRRVGLVYRSSQASTAGVGTATERFADAAVNPGRVDRARTYAGRLAEAAAPRP